MKKLILKSLFCLILLLVLRPAFANYDFNKNCKDAYHEIIKLDFYKAKQLIAKEKKVNPSNLIVFYLDNTIDFLYILLSEEKNIFNTLKKNKDTRLSHLEKGDEKSPFYRFCIAETHLQWAASRIIFNEYVSAAFEINKAYALLKKNQEEFPSFIPNMKSLGLLNALIGSIPDNFKWVTSIIGINGTIEQGINQLAIVFKASLQNDTYDYLKAESLFFLAYINLHLNNDTKEVIRILKYIENNKDMQELVKTSALVNYSVANLYLRTKGYNNKVISVLDIFFPCKNCFNYPYRDYTNGLARLYRLDKDASFYFKKYLHEYKGENAIKSAYQKLAWCALINDDTASYVYNIEKIKFYGALNTDEDKLAQAEAENNNIPNVLLLKARLLFDGGYYDKALNSLENVKAEEIFSEKKDLLEYDYRLARIYHESGEIINAVPYYLKTIKNGKDEIFYFAANSCIQLGIIYESMNNTDLAREYYKKATSMKNTEYRNSISQKSKAGLNRLKKE